MTKSDMLAIAAVLTLAALASLTCIFTAWRRDLVAVVMHAILFMFLAWLTIAAWRELL